MTDVAKTHNLLRIDRGDFEFATADALLESARALGANLLANPAGTRRWVVSGFDMDEPSAGQFRVQGGVAILAYREDGAVKEGALQTGGSSSRTIDVSALADATYNVYIRFELSDGDFQNRVFWNPSTSAEFVQNVATKRISNWGVRLAAASPGGEWTQIGQAAVAGGEVTTITDLRPMYFEGVPDSSYARAWGSGNDRNADRSQYGLKDLRTALDALFKKVEEIQSGTNAEENGGTAHRWWEAPAHGSLDDMIPLDGSSDDSTRIRGTLQPLTHEDIDFGQAGLRWGALFARHANLSGTLYVSGQADLEGLTNVNNASLNQIASHPVATIRNTAADGISKLRVEENTSNGFVELGQDLDADESFLNFDSVLRIQRAGVSALSLSGAVITVGSGVGSVLPAGGATNLGDGSNRWALVGADNLDVNSAVVNTGMINLGTLTVSGALDLTGGAGSVIGDFSPKNAGTSQIGTGNLDAFGAIHGQQLYAHTQLHTGPIIDASGDPWTRRFYNAVFCGMVPSAQAQVGPNAESMNPPGTKTEDFDGLYVVDQGGTGTGTLKRVRVYGRANNANGTNWSINIRSIDYGTNYYSTTFFTDNTTRALLHDDDGLSISLPAEPISVRVEQFAYKGGVGSTDLEVSAIVLDVEYLSLQQVLGFI